MNKYILISLILLLVGTVVVLVLKHYKKIENFIIGCSNDIPFTDCIKGCNNDGNFKNPLLKSTNVCTMIKNREVLATDKFFKPCLPKIQCFLNKHNNRHCSWR